MGSIDLRSSQRICEQLVTVFADEACLYFGCHKAWMVADSLQEFDVRYESCNLVLFQRRMQLLYGDGSAMAPDN